MSAPCDDAMTDNSTTPSVSVVSGSDIEKSHSPQVILRFNKKYFWSVDCPLRFLQVVCSVICLALVTSVHSVSGDYLSLPFSSHLRLIVFTCVLAVLIDLFIIILRLSTVVTIFRFDWNIFDIVVYGFILLLFSLSSILLIINVARYSDQRLVLPWPSLQIFAVSLVFTISCSMLHGTTVVLSLCRRQRSLQREDMGHQRILLSQQVSVSTVISQLPLADV